MTATISHDLGLVRESADRLLHDVNLLGDDTLAGPSLLPGWSRAHVVGHLIGNAEGLTRLLHWARSGEPTPQYPDQHARDAGIEAAVGRGVHDLARGLSEATDAFLGAAHDLPADAWAATVRLGAGGAGRAIEASELPWRRLVEQEVHNVDLDGPYTPAHWSTEFVHRLLEESAQRYLARPDVPPLALEDIDGDWSAACGDAAARTLVEGPAPALLAWLTGRSAGQGLHVPDGALPSLPAWF